MTKLPTSRAKTAYGLLSEVIKIARNPRRIRMEMWFGDVERSGIVEDERPACGTVGCIGGWTEFLYQQGGKRAFKRADEILGFPTMANYGSDAQAENDVAINGLFYSDVCNDAKQGTVKHARRVISLIRRFQRTHKARLLRTKV